ncbi:hypothetical protein [Rhizobium sp. G21]|uniref:hypothetical protein n=1 Tax=Rhizobium sp. G21 TaxID=2758439 RepID=UPI001602FF59|nr:hypothetical protein [Rhizobium sp. G21]MBB1247480.1 hypothetical protein [Rhizobium sp. G21]
MSAWMLLPIDATDGMIEAAGMEPRAAMELWERMARAAAPDLQRHLMSRAEARAAMRKLFTLGHAAGGVGDPDDLTEEAQAIVNALMGDD